MSFLFIHKIFFETFPSCIEPSLDKLCKVTFNSSVNHYSVEVTDKLYIDNRCGQWCKLPYPNHPDGCPNYGQRNYCPPYAPLVSDFFDFSKQYWFLITEFDLAAHVDAFRIKQPSWSERRLKCVLYWQNKVRSIQRQQIIEFRLAHPNTVFTQLPEAMNTNVLRTLQSLRINFETKPEKKVLKVALLGYMNPSFIA